MHRLFILLPALLLACASDRADDDDDDDGGSDSGDIGGDGGSSVPGAGDGQVDIAELSDEEGLLPASWTAESATWAESDGTFQLWYLDPDINRLERDGPVNLDHLTLSTDRISCATFQGLLDRSATLVEGIDEEIHFDRICDEIGVFLDGERQAASGDAVVSLTSRVSPLGELPPADGSWADPEVSAVLRWKDAGFAPWEAWSADACEFEDLQWPDQRVVSLSGEAIELSVGADTVTGTLTGPLDAGDGASGDVTATFEAARCRYDGGPVVLIRP